jgi:hypothetical protein
MASRIAGEQPAHATETKTSKSAPATVNPAEVIRALRTLHPDLGRGGVVEVRAMEVPGYRGNPGMWSGYFDDADAAASEAVKLANACHEGRSGNIYITVNPVDPDLLSRAANRAKELRGKKAEGATTNDKNVGTLCWFFIDLDPERPAGISASDEQLTWARERAERIRADLVAAGWPAPVVAVSGNGIHLLFRIQLAARQADLLSRCLSALDHRYSDERVKVDKTTFNASRLITLYGTVKRKGDDTDARPHRQAHLVHVPAELSVVPTELLEGLAATAPAAPLGSSKNPKRAAPATEPAAAPVGVAPTPMAALVALVTDAANASAAPPTPASAAPPSPAKPAMLPTDPATSGNGRDTSDTHHANGNGQGQAHGWLIEWTARAAQAGLEVGAAEPWNGGGLKFKVHTCPHCCESDGAAVLGALPTGGIFYRCHHDRCAEFHWSDFKAHYEDRLLASQIALVEQAVALAEKGDGGAPLEPDVRAALAVVDRRDPVAFERFWQRLRGKTNLKRLRSLLDSERSFGGSRAPSSPYVERDGCLFRRRATPDGYGEVKLCNFTAHIVAEVRRDDGSDELESVFEVEVTIDEKRRVLRVPSTQFENLRWVAKLGADAILEPGQGTREWTRHAIQSLSPRPLSKRRLYLHTGWTEATIDGPVYLHARGALGEYGPVASIDVELTDTLARFELPVPPSGADLQRAVRASLNVLKVAPHEVSVPVWAAVWRAPLGPMRSGSVYLLGTTGTHKSCLTALAQAHYGRTLSYKSLPATWEGTANHLESLAFLAKDALLVIDDFIPKGARQDRERLHASADRIFRSTTAGVGRGRLRGGEDLSHRANRPPRGLLMSSGEELPGPPSCQARLVIVKVERGAVDLARLTAAQEDATAGLYAQALAAYVRWLAPRAGSLVEETDREMRGLRADLTRDGVHRGTPDAAADLLIGVRMWARFAREQAGIEAEEVERVERDALKALTRVVEDQAHAQAEADPVRRFLSFLVGALTGRKAHIAGRKAGVPDVEDPSVFGWRREAEGSEAQRNRDRKQVEAEQVTDMERAELTRTLATGEVLDALPEGGGLSGQGATVDEHARWIACGPRIGFVDGGDLYLLPGPSVAVAKSEAEAAGEMWSTSPRAIGGMLRERSLLLTTRDDGRLRDRVPQTLIESRPYAFVIRLSRLFDLDPADDPAGPEPTGPPAATGPLDLGNATPATGER